MIEKLAETMRPALDCAFIRRTRRNHGLEHATVHILYGQIKNLRVAGRSTSGGFMLIGDVPTEAVQKAADDALRRMRAGEHRLAVHPNCGTNLATTGLLTALVGLFGFGLGRKRTTLNHFSNVMTMMILAVVVAQPLGMDIQRHITTEGNLGDLRIVGVTRREVRIPFLDRVVIVHYIQTREGTEEIA